MASALAQQLSQLAQAKGDNASQRIRGKASLLFDYQKAADVDVQTIYTIGLQGGCSCRMQARCRACISWFLLVCSTNAVSGLWRAVRR